MRKGLCCQCDQSGGSCCDAASGEGGPVSEFSMPVFASDNLPRWLYSLAWTKISSFCYSAMALFRVH